MLLNQSRSEQRPIEQDWDTLWEAVLSPSSIDAARRQGESKYDKLTSDEVSYYRSRCKTDLFFLTNAILGYERLSPRLHGSLCRWLSDTQEEQFRMILLPRAHFKTTVATIADAIQAILPSDGGQYPWPRNLGPNGRVLFAHESHEGATRFLYEVAAHFCNNPRLMGLFPELVPSPRHQRMNKWELELPRTEHWAEPTFDTIGVGGRSQGRHYNLIKLDDLFGDKARDSKAERETTIQWFDNIQSFFVRLAMDHMDLIGTRWSLDDVYAHAMRVYDDRIIKYIRRIREKQADGIVAPIFPEEFTEESLSILRKNPKVWAAQYVNDPHEGFAEFDPSWKRWYYRSARDRISFFIGQSSSATSYNIHELDICMLIDPAVTGNPGIIVTATDDNMRIFVLEAIKKPMKPHEFVNCIFQLVQRYWPRVVAIEEVVFSAMYAPWFQREMQLRNVRFNIVPVKPRKLRGVEDHSKPGRIRGLSTYFSAGQVFFHENQADLIEEFDNFGASGDIHLLDALAYGPEVWRKGLSGKQHERYRRLEEELWPSRDIETGYSTI